MGDVTPGSFDDWRRQFSALARRTGISRTTLDTVLADVVPDPEVVARDRRQAEASLTLPQYLSQAVSAARVDRGKQAFGRARGMFDRLAARFGVGGEILAAIWGIESDFGANRGDFDVATALATLAFDGRRRILFEGELLALMGIVQSARSGRSRFRGSWAGAMGHTQVMPRTWSRAAVDFDGDGLANVWDDDPTDALATAANVLRISGWQPSVPPLVTAILPASPDWCAIVPDTTQRAQTWRRLGLRFDTNVDVLTLRLPFGASGPALLSTPNFDALMRYNRSEAYALAVSSLATAIAGDPILPDDLAQPPALTPQEIAELQGTLVELGHDTGGIDGIAGPATRRSVRQFQLENGMCGDGFADRIMLTAMREKVGRK